MKRYVRAPRLLVIVLAVIASATVVSGCSSDGSSLLDVVCTPSQVSSSNQLGTATAGLTLAQAIQTDAAGNNELAASMIFGSEIEDGFNPNSVGKYGGYGAFQIQEPGVVHTDITQAEALDPVYATNYMLSRYENGLKNVDPSLWVSNPMLAMEDAAINAEAPQYRYDDYADNGRNKDSVPDAYQATLQVMGQLGIPTNFGAATIQDNTSDAVTTNIVSQPAGNCSVDELAAYTGATGAANVVVQTAYAVLEQNIPYSYGGGNAKGPTKGVCETGTSGWNDCNVVGFDCSGLVLYAFAKVGITFPHLAADQYNETKAHTVTTSVDDLSNAQPGDLVFFVGSEGSRSAPGHVGIYVGNGQMINAPESGEDVSLTTITTAPRRDDFIAITDPFAGATAVRTA